ncbi:hypothetical protein SESBI_24831 [Sesbania bispinosa]|nr:hypothetical protein SESBI_24831 [Sesbania bispinosa]
MGMVLLLKLLLLMMLHIMGEGLLLDKGKRPMDASVSASGNGGATAQKDKGKRPMDAYVSANGNGGATAQKDKGKRLMEASFKASTTINVKKTKNAVKNRRNTRAASADVPKIAEVGNNPTKMSQTSVTANRGGSATEAVGSGLLQQIDTLISNIITTNSQGHSDTTDGTKDFAPGN